MSQDGSLKAEVDALRAEVQALRAQQAAHACPVVPAWPYNQTVAAPQSCICGMTQVCPAHGGRGAGIYPYLNVWSAGAAGCAGVPAAYTYTVMVP